MEHLVFGEKLWHNKFNLNVDETVASLEASAQLHNRIYPGVDLRDKFDSEIWHYLTEWEWIKDRIRTNFYKGILIGDYLPLLLTDGKTFKMDVAGMDTYYNYGDTAISHHIDFISRDCHPDTMPFNQVNYNNGTSVSPNPWLASRLYAQLNSLAMDVPNSATANPEMVSVNYTTTGVLDKIPIATASLIVEKRIALPSRYTSGYLLTDDNSWPFRNIGKLWIPSEVEVYGCEHWGSRNGMSGGGFQQYPIFATNMKRIKGAGNGGVRSNWWLLSASKGNSANIAISGGIGYGADVPATNNSTRVPLCFRIA